MADMSARRVNQRKNWVLLLVALFSQVVSVHATLMLEYEACIRELYTDASFRGKLGNIRVGWTHVDEGREHCDGLVCEPGDPSRACEMKLEGDLPNCSKCVQRLAAWYAFHEWD